MPERGDAAALDLSVVIPVYNEEESLPPLWAELLRLELEAFLEAGPCGRVVPATAADGLIAVEVSEAATRSAQLGRVVTLAELR